MNKYLKFFLMIATSTLLMFFIMYFNLFSFSHFIFSQTRLFMALMMGAAMAIIMLVFMWKMYPNKKANVVILCGSILLFAGSLFMVRSQTAVDDVAWMKAMIPHHSIAILTSDRANLTDPEVKELAKKILEAQEAEIDEMKELIEKLEEQ